MNSLENAYAHKRNGCLREALRALDVAHITPEEHTSAEVLRAELLGAVGQYDRAVARAVSLLGQKRLTSSQRAACEQLLGEVLVEAGDVDNGLARFQRAASLAEEGGNLDRLFHIQLNLMSVLSERSGPGAATAILVDVRRLATKLGDPAATSRLHLLVAQMEAKRALFENAMKHIAIARNILGTYPNAYLQAFAANLQLAVAVLCSQFDAAKVHGEQAIRSAERSGVATIHSASLANMGNLCFAVGDLDLATEYFERALVDLPSHGARTNAALESLARVHLTQGRLSACAEILDRIEGSVRADQDRLFYGHRYAELTRIELIAARGEMSDALSRVDGVLDLATRASDSLLLKRTQLVKAELLQQIGCASEAMTSLEGLVPTLGGDFPEMYARSEQIVSFALAFEGRLGPARLHHDRANRMYVALGNVPAQIELAHRWTAAAQSHSLRSQADTSSTVIDSHVAAGARHTLHAIATAVAHANRPELVAREMADILAITAIVDSARVSVVGDTDAGDQQTAAEDLLEPEADGAEYCLTIGFHNGREVRVTGHAKRDVESRAGVNAIRMLLCSFNEIQRGRAERDRAATLWPLDDAPGSNDRSVVTGHMRDLMGTASRIARTSVNVLITGESGTGKEILARAIHDFSDRARKPFVPFNCTAIPRDLLESQLFGHRRGAFTGADRDQLGLIRSARDGTLFLDEIGELALDLQPKLLRFLESGEIAPLGETGSTNVNVRIVAATNTHLEEAVRAGRFREDLFYRLNVVRMSIRPLRERRDEIPSFVNHFVTHASDEFDKGNVRVAEETMERLLLYRWPGNVRQLQNEVRRMVAFAEPNATLMPQAISEDILGALPDLRRIPVNGTEIAVPLHGSLMSTLTRIESEMIKAALAQHGGKVDAVAKALGISRKGLYLKRQRLGL